MGLNFLRNSFPSEEGARIEADFDSDRLYDFSVIIKACCVYFDFSLM